MARRDLAKQMLEKPSGHALLQLFCEVNVIVPNAGGKRAAYTWQEGTDLPKEPLKKHTDDALLLLFRAVHLIVHRQYAHGKKELTYRNN